MEYHFQIFSKGLYLKFKKYYYLAVGFYLIAVIISTIDNYLATKATIMKKIDTVLEQSVKIAPLILPPHFHHKNMLLEGVSSQTDMTNIKKLSEQAKTLGVKYIYTIVEDDKKIIFTSSSATQEELTANTNLSHFGDVYDDVSPLVYKVFSSQKSSFDEYEDKWGKFHTFYLPQISEDGTKYLVCADIDISHIDKELQKNIFYSIKDTIFYILILIPFFLVYRMNMHQIKKELEETIQQKAKELKLKQREVVQKSKMAEMGEMISNIAHQWRQPLSVITTNASGVMVQDELNFLTKETLRSSMENIMKNSQYLSTTVDNFRNFFTPNKPKEIKHLSEIFEIIDCIFGNSLVESNIQLVKNIQNITLNTYVNELAQVLINFIKNGKDAIGEEGVIFIDCYVEDKIYIKVKDSGGGIPLDIMDKIYDPYFTTKDSSIGTGIGLNMSQQIITEHLGGEIKVHNTEFTYENKIYKGAEFIVTLPKDILVEE
jgi:signal transduction histidine kinase